MCNNNNVQYKLSFMIFRTGSILIVGKCDEETLYKVYNFIKEILENEYKKIYIKNVDKNLVKPIIEKKVKKRIIYVS